MARISKPDWAMSLAVITAQRTTCLRRAVGCVLLDKHWRVLSTGYNGVARGQSHCNDSSSPLWGNNRLIEHPHACPGAKSPSGTDLDSCRAIHAEQNALLQVNGDALRDIEHCFVTTSPCITCTKMLLNTSCQNIWFLYGYAHHSACELWRGSGRTWTPVATCSATQAEAL